MTPMRCMVVESKLEDRNISPFELMTKLFKEGRYITPPLPLKLFVLKGCVFREKKGSFVIELNRLFLWLIILLDNKLVKSLKSFLH
jgi:hypothetical protein